MSVICGRGQLRTKRIIYITRSTDSAGALLPSDLKTPLAPLQMLSRHLRDLVGVNVKQLRQLRQRLLAFLLIASPVRDYTGRHQAEIPRTALLSFAEPAPIAPLPQISRNTN
jgi:hypothetical protein